MTTQPSYTAEIKTFTNWTYALGTVGGLLQSCGAIIEDKTWGVTAGSATTESDIISLMSSLYELIAKMNGELNSAIETMKSTEKPVAYQLEPFVMPAGSFLPENPSVITEAWNAVDPALTRCLPLLDKDPVLLETAEAILSKGKAVAKASAQLIVHVS